MSSSKADTLIFEEDANSQQFDNDEKAKKLVSNTLMAIVRKLGPTFVPKEFTHAARNVFSSIISLSTTLTYSDAIQFSDAVNGLTLDADIKDVVKRIFPNFYPALVNLIALRHLCFKKTFGVVDDHKTMCTARTEHGIPFSYSSFKSSAPSSSTTDMVFATESGDGCELTTSELDDNCGSTVVDPSVEF